MNEDLLKIYDLLEVKQIPSDRNYWLIRTESGKFFEDFIENNYVAIGWDEFSSKDYFLTEKEQNIKDKISMTYPNEKRPGYIYNQIKRFIFDIKKGDMILIPSENSVQIAFGIVTDDFFVRLESKNINNVKNPKCIFKKCISVQWESILFKEKFDPYLKMLLFTHTTISNVNDYKEQINRILYSKYMLDNIVHVTFNVTTTEDIGALKLLQFLNLISHDSINLFNDLTGENLDINSVNLKLSVQSPGPIEFIGYATGGILVACAVCALLFGIKINLHLLGIIKFNVDTPGLATHALKFLKEFLSDKKEIMKIKNELECSKDFLKLSSSENITQHTNETINNTLQENSNIQLEEQIENITEKESDYQQISFDDNPKN